MLHGLSASSLPVLKFLGEARYVFERSVEKSINFRRKAYYNCALHLVIFVYL